MESSLNVIPVVYNGISFRSKIEAKNALVWDDLGIRWIYEPKRLKVAENTIYIPDFDLPDFSFFVEIKGFEFDQKQDRKVRLACKMKPILVLIGGLPSITRLVTPETHALPNISFAYIFDSALSAPIKYSNVWLSECLYCGSIGFCIEDFSTTHLCECPSLYKNCYDAKVSDRILDAYKHGYHFDFALAPARSIPFPDVPIEHV